MYILHTNMHITCQIVKAANVSLPTRPVNIGMSMCEKVSVCGLVQM